MVSVVSWGELLWDRFPDAQYLGGAAANVAYHAAKLGADAFLVSTVGRDALGQRAVAELGHHGVKTDLIHVDPSAPTGVVDVEFEAGEPKFRLASSAAWDRLECNDAVLNALGEASVFYYGTLAQRTALACDALTRALAVRGPLKVCDVNLRPPFVSRRAVEACVLRADVVKMNEHELHALARLLDVADVVAALRERGAARFVAVTRGGAGAELWASGTWHQCGSVPAASDDSEPHTGEYREARSKQGDAVGAGDAFSAVLGLALAKHLAPAAALAAANRYAGYVASRVGAMPPAPDFIDELRF